MLEKLNNNDWRERLDAYDRLHDEVFDKSGAWGKLQERITGKQAKPKTTWYWIAASLLLLTTAIGYQLKQTPRIAEIVKTKVAPTNKPVEHKAFVQKEIQYRAKEKPLTTPISFKKKSKSVIKAKQQDSTSVSPAVEEPQLEIAFTREESDTQQLVIPTKKKLAVVHINNLHLPTEQKDRFVHSEKSKRENGLLNGSSLDYPFSSHSPDDNILKIRLSPNN